MHNQLAENRQQSEQPVQREYRVGNYFAAIFIDIFLLYVINNLISNVPHPLDQYASKDYPGIINNIVNWVVNFQVPFLTHDFVSCLWAINLALGLGIIGNFVLLLYRPYWFHHLVQAILAAVGFFAVYLVYKTFPFSIDNDTLRLGIRALLIIIMAALSVSLIIELIRFIKSPISSNKTGPRESDGSQQP